MDSFVLVRRLCAAFALLASLVVRPAAAQDQIELPVPAGSAGFGAAVDIRTQFIAVGAPLTSSSQGAVYIFRRTDDDAWVPDATLLAPDAVNGGNFGGAVAFGPDDRLAVGAERTAEIGGAVYVFRRTAEGAWVLEQTLRASGRLGENMAFNETYIAAGGGLAGVRVWEFDGASWVDRCTSTPSPASLTLSIPYLVYSHIQSASISIQDVTTCETVSTFSVEDLPYQPDVSANLGRLAYTGGSDVLFRATLLDPATEVVLNRLEYEPFQFVALRREYLLAATRFNNVDTPELFVLRQTGYGGWGVYRKAYSTSARPSALALSNRYAVVGAPNGETGRAFVLDLLALPIFDPPRLYAPAPDAVVPSTPLPFTWGAVDLAQSYVLEVDNSPTFGSPLVSESGLTDTTFVVESGLRDDRPYYWRVRGDRSGQVGPWSEVRLFTTAPAGAPGAPPLASPGDGVQNLPLSVTLRWQARTGADVYQVQLASALDFATPLLDETTTALQQTAGGLLNGQEYFWRVRSGNEVGLGGWSPVRSFTTVPVAPVVPVLFAPDDGAVDVGTNPRFVWSPPSQLATYTLQVSTAADFSNLAVSEAALTDTTYQVTTPLQPARLHYWRVRAVSGAGTTDWSDVFSFVTGVTIGAEDGGLPTAFALSDIRPNPSAAAVAFRVDVPTAGRVRLAVYDALGREVAVLLDGETAAGTLTPSFDASRLAPGLYVARLTAGAFAQTRRFTVAR